MPDFNKGDFTQQGVAGHVNANLRLNEKRLVSIDLTSNEEAEGCTIIGTVKDLLNDKVYGIGSGVSGNIEITENGENINVAPYATATVNVAGGGGTDIKTCAVTLVNDGATPVSALGYNFIDSDGYYNGISGLDANETRTMDLLIGKVEVMFDPGNYDYVCTITDITGVYVSYANNVNCTVNYSELGTKTVNIVIADTTLPASVEIHFNVK